MNIKTFYVSTSLNKNLNRNRRDNVYVPTQSVPFPEKPSKQLQSYDPGLLVHVALT